MIMESSLLGIFCVKVGKIWVGGKGGVCFLGGEGVGELVSTPGGVEGMWAAGVQVGVAVRGACGDKKKSLG